VPGRPSYAYQWRLASGSQLWRLNQLGRLRVVDDAVCLSASEPKRLIEAELEQRAGKPDLLACTLFSPEREAPAQPSGSSS
jgi:hypothetical protein